MTPGPPGPHDLAIATGDEEFVEPEAPDPHRRGRGDSDGLCKGGVEPSASGPNGLACMDCRPNRVCSAPTLWGCSSYLPLYLVDAAQPGVLSLRGR